jgi:hypothetical protein
MKNQQNINTLEEYKENLQKQLGQITNSKFYKLFKKYKKVKKVINPKTYFRFIKNKIKKYKYSLSDFEMPHHDFIILITKTNKWEINGYEKIGEDWHIRVIRKTDEKQFLLDQPVFYYLQIFDDKNINLEKELFITYGITNEKLKKIKKSIESLELC